MALHPFTNEQLNYFKFAFVVLNEFPKVLRQTFKHMWDNKFAHLPGYQPWDDSIAVRNLFLATEGGKTKVPTHLPYEEWDCTALFQATIYAQSFALPDRAGHHRTLSDLYLKHCKPSHGTFHSSVVSPGGNNAETFAMAIDQLRLLRNALCHPCGSEIDKKTFDQYIQHTKDAIKALGVATDPIDAVGSLTESDFPTEKVFKLKDDITKKLQTENTFLKENVEDELIGVRSDLAQSRQERQEDSLELRKTIAEVKDLLKTERQGTKAFLPRSNLPPKVPNFIGREEECDEIVGHLTSKFTRLVSVWGSPGFGKTSVAIAVGHHLQARELPVYFLSLRGLKSKSDLASKFLCLFRQGGTLETDKLQDLSADDELCLIFDKLLDRFVIILDNADDLLECGEPNVKEEFFNLIGEIVNRSDKVHFLLTTRESLSFLNLHFQGHKSVRIKELDQLSCQTLAAELLPEATTSDLTKISQICGQVPLAIKLLCCSIPQDFALSQYLKFLECTGSIVEMLDNPDYPSISRLRSLFESSFQRLSTQDREALVSLCTLPAHFDLKISGAVLGINRANEAEKVLQRLQRKSLIDCSSQARKFSTHKLIQSFAREKGEADMKETVLISKYRFRAFYIAQFEKLNEKFLSGRSMSAFIEFYEDEINIVQSLIDGCLDPRTADRVFDVLAKAELFLDTLFWSEGSTFDNIFDSAIMAANQTEKNVFYRRLLISKAFGEVTWGASGNTEKLLSLSKTAQVQTSSHCYGDKGKHLCYYGIHQLVIGKTEDGVKVLEEALSSMNTSKEHTILKLIIFQIFAIYYQSKNDSVSSSNFYQKALKECRDARDTGLLVITMPELAKSKVGEHSNILTNKANLSENQPLQVEVIFLVSKGIQNVSIYDTNQMFCNLLLTILNGCKSALNTTKTGWLVFHRNIVAAVRSFGGHEDALKLTEVPQQILARGPLALDAYRKALSEGETCEKRVPIMLIGQDRSGKTSLNNSLMGKPFNEDEDSTVGIAVDPSYFKVSSAIWKVGEKDQETNSETSISYEHHVARLTVENLIQVENISKERDPERMQKISSDIVPSECSDEYDNSAPLTVEHLRERQIKSLSEEMDPELMQNFSSDVVPTECIDEYHNCTSSSSHAQTPSHHKQSTDSMSGMPHSIATLIEKMQGDDYSVEDKEDIYSVIWDFGGQSVYYVTHPLFLTSKAIYLLVNDLSRDPSERAKSVMKQGMYSTSVDSLDFRTNLDYLDFWMSSISSLAIDDDGDQQGSRSEMVPDKLPPVFLVCTHADTPYDGGDPSKLAYKVFGSLQTKPYKTHLYDDVFVVDNTKSGKESECSEVMRLRTEILDLAKELPQMKEAIPIKWLRYEKLLQDVKHDGHKWIPLDRANQLASEVCNIVDDKQFHTLLNFLHDKRILIHFDDTPELNRLVVLDLQWLIDVFKGVITVRPFCGKEKKFKELWCKLERKGILDEKLLEHVWNDLFLPQETSGSLIAIMEKFSLLCHLPLSDESCCKQYLVPSMLKFPPPDGIVELIKSAELPSLFLQFESGLVPPGLFPRLVLQFFHRAKDECVTSEDPHLYHNFARFYTSEENYSVILFCHLFSIEVVVHKGNSSQDISDRLQSKPSLSEDASFHSCVRAVRRQLQLILESMRKEFCWLKNMRYTVSFICPVCCEGNAVKYCGTHDAKRCEQEECLHFWSESQLCSVETLFCKKSAVAQNNRVPTDQFVPWLMPLGNQHTADEQDCKCLGPAEATKEVALPGEVYESLLSQSCDASEVVLQMRHNLQLEQASLEHPDAETKTLIRCLARTAKDSKRLDVFEHLRKILPAGTTGPLLPENLDVRCIPVSQVRNLTIDLSGREEWKAVAEALGLTSSEIRFLDKRTLNPLDAALCFVARQRYITVGYLYDLLNKHGFPVIADFL